MVVEEVAQEVGLVIQVDQNVYQVDSRQARLDQLFKAFHLVRGVSPFQRGQVEFTLVGIDGECLVTGDTLVNACSHRG